MDLFFALSGFLITTLLLRERDAAGYISAKGFYSRRARRIFPLYYAVLGLYALHALLVRAPGPQRDHFFRSLPYFATYTTNWFVDFAVPHPVSFAFSWSLAVEEQFYLVWPWLLMLTVRFRRARWLVPAFTSLTLLAIDQGVLHGLFLDALVPGGLPRRLALGLSTPICMGSLVALVLHAPRGFAYASPLVGSRASAILLFGALVLCVGLDGVPLWLAQLVLTLVTAACAMREDHSLRWLLNGRAVRWVGTVSYGIYLFHVALITGARQVLPESLRSPGWVFLIVLPIAIGVASASYVWFERPLLRHSRVR